MSRRVSTSLEGRTTIPPFPNRVAVRFLSGSRAMAGAPATCLRIRFLCQEPENRASPGCRGLGEDPTKKGTFRKCLKRRGRALGGLFRNSQLPNPRESIVCIFAPRRFRCCFPCAEQMLFDHCCSSPSARSRTHNLGPLQNNRTSKVAST